jgi:hypothetical protein
MSLFADVKAIQLNTLAGEPTFFLGDQWFEAVFLSVKGDWV